MDKELAIRGRGSKKIKQLKKNNSRNCSQEHYSKNTRIGTGRDYPAIQPIPDLLCAVP